MYPNKNNLNLTMLIKDKSCGVLLSYIIFIGNIGCLLVGCFSKKIPKIL